MNTNQPFENDKPLREVLGAWRVEATLPPRFQERVWERIGDGERFPRSIWMTMWQRFATLAARPAFAAAYLAAFLVVGASAGYERGHTKTAHVKTDLQARYVQMVDPYKTPR